MDAGFEAGVMRLAIETSPPLLAVMREEFAAGERAVTEAVRAAGSKIKTEWRSEIVGAGLGTRLANTIRSQVYPSGRDSIRAAALVWSKAPIIVGAHETGAVIRSRRGLFLTIPLPAAGKSRRGGHVTPREFEQRTGLRLRLVYRRPGPSLLVAEARVSSRGTAAASRSKTGRGVASVPVFLLVPQVRLRKRLDLAGAAERVAASVPALVAARWVEGRL